ncbi:hypothetical protein [Nesterenkonia pannonica]|uniref:hypothetical protein n=1 Tax=Nesterenkonia pannonica TaxID=1548602 RepID=UPI002164D57F|nr:hypothetical protein [Nesterenkonia pannonica]
MRAIIERFLSAETLSNPQRIHSVVEGMTPYLDVDEALNAESVAGYAVGMRDVREATFTCSPCLAVSTRPPPEARR